MIIDYSTICLPETLFSLAGQQEKPLGRAEALSVLLVSSGQCAVAEYPALLVQAGHFLLAKGEITLSPFEECHIIGAVLSGLAAEQFCAALEAPLVIDAAACPETPEVLYRLEAGGQTLSVAQRSALAYTMLCQFTEAKANPMSLPPLVLAAIQAMREHFAEVYGIEELAAQLGVSKSHLVRSFSAALGTTPGKYLTAVRLEAAKKYLLHREYPLEVVASLCGFSGANYLCKVFKKETGETPAAWRRHGASAGPAASGLVQGEELLFL